MRKHFLTIGLLTLALNLGCQPADELGEGYYPECQGKCDGIYPEVQPTYMADMEAVNALWSGDTPMQTIEDAYKVTMVFGDQVLPPAPTHLFGGPVKVIPYHNSDDITDAAGNVVERGDDQISKVFPPGTVGYAVKHHRPEYRKIVLNLKDEGEEGDGAEPEGMKEHFKLQDTHIELVVGVERDGKPGVITLNNPQGYEGGRFGTAKYSMIFVRPKFPEYIGLFLQKAFNDNIRSMMLAFNAVSDFPGDYNGGDPLAVYDADKVIEHSKMMMIAIAGDPVEAEKARAWFTEPAHKIYCAELAHVATSAGLHMPLNAKTFVPLVGEAVWKRFVELAEKHNQGEDTPFTELNDNAYASMVKIAIDENDIIDPMWSYAPAGWQEELSQRVAFNPMTMSDMVEHFVRTHLSRELMGESLASVQAKFLKAMKPGLLNIMEMDELDPEVEPRKTVETVYSQIIDTVGQQHGQAECAYLIEDPEMNKACRYFMFRNALKPSLGAARMITGPRPGSEPGKAFFVPPSVLHIVAQGSNPGGLMGLQYVGHGLHYSVVKPLDMYTPPVVPFEPEPAVQPIPDQPEPAVQPIPDQPEPAVQPVPDQPTE